MPNSLQPHGLCSPPRSMESSKQECWSGLAFPSPEKLPDPGIKPVYLSCTERQIFFYHLSHLGHEKYSNNKKDIFNLTVQYPEKYSTTIQQLAYWGWHQVNKQEELLTGGDRGGRRW